MIRSILIVLFLCTFLYSQEQEEIAAKAGTIEITKSEFEERFQLNPQLNIHRKAQGDANKRLFLYGLIAEKLLAQDALDNKYDTAASVNFYLKNFEKMFVRDELYNKEVRRKSKEYASNILSFYLQNSSRIFTRSIFSKDENNLKGMYHLVKTGMPFNDIYDELPAAEKDTITLYAGTLDDKTEHELFSLPEKSISKPLKYNDYWVIFYIESKNDPVSAKSMGWESEYKRLEKAASEKAEAVFYKKFMEEFFTGKKVETSGLLIKSAAEKITALLEDVEISDTSGYVFGTSDFVKVFESYSLDTLNQVFVRFDEEPLYFRDFLNWLRTELFKVKENNYITVVSVLNSKAKKFVEYELLAREGYRQNLHNSGNVQKMVSMWRENYLYQLRLNAVSDSLLPKSASYSVSLAEIFTDDLETIEKALNEIAEGKDFIETAGKYSAQIPDTSYRAISSLEEMRDEVTQAQPGDVYGPILTKDGYLLFKLLGKKEASTALTGNQTVSNPFNTYIAELAEKYGLNINDEVISSVRSSNVNAVVFKYLGFGGRISAVPIIMPISEWIEEWRKNELLNP